MYDGVIEADSGWRYTACGIKVLNFGRKFTFQSVFTRMESNEYNVTQDGQSFTYSVGGLQYNKQLTFAVVVERLNGYVAAYEAVVFNSKDEQSDD